MAGADKKKKRNVTRLLEDRIMLVVSIIFSVLLIASYFGGSVHPNNISYIAILSLGFPLLYVLEIFLCLYWIIRWRLYALVILLVLLCGAPRAALYYRVELTKEYEHHKESKRTDITLMSYNVCGFIGSQGAMMDSIMSVVRSSNPAVLCMQEFQTTPQITKESIDACLEDYPYQRVKYGRFFSNNNSGWGLAVYSKYPIINSKYIDFPDTNNAAMWVDLKINKDTLRVYNVHLQSTKVSSKEIDFLRYDMAIDSTANGSRDKIKSILHRIALSNQQRASQVDSLKIHLERNTYPVIVCGDFNDTPLSYSYTQLGKGLKDAFLEKGKGFSATYSGLVRIDYVFYSEPLTLKSYSVPESDVSDHYPVLVRFDRL